MTQSRAAVVRGLVGAEWRRHAAAGSNLLNATDRASRLRVARTGLVACGLLAAGGWLALRTLFPDPAQPRAQGPFAALATLLALLVAADGFRRGSGAFGDAGARGAWDRWFRTAGVPRYALVVLGVARATLLAGLVCWVPLMPLAPGLGGAPLVLLSGLSVGWAAWMAGDAAGRVWYDARWPGRLGVAAPAVFILAQLLLTFASQGPASGGLRRWMVPAVTAGVWDLLAQAPLVVAPLMLALGLAASAWAHTAEIERAGWRVALRTAAPHAGAAGAAASTSPWAALAGRDLRVLRARARRDVLVVAQGAAALVLLGAALAWIPPVLSAYLVRPAVIPWVLLLASFVPAGEYAEALWGGEHAGKWSYLRSALPRPRIAVRARLLSVAAGLAAWHLCLALAVSGPSRSLGAALLCGALGLLMAASAAALGTAGAFATLHGGYVGTVAGRYVRSVALWAGLTLPAAVYAATLSLPWAAASVLVLGPASLRFAESRYIRTQFLSLPAPPS